MMKICSIAISSSWNCIYIGTDLTHILVDAGISCKRVKSGLESIDVDPGSIDAVLITHEHSDHIRGLGVLSRKYNIPVYATELTWRAVLSSGTIGEIDKNLFRKIIPDTDFAINELVIHPFKTSHDAADPVCFCSPHARGWTGGCAIIISHPSLFPARAGMNRSNLW